VRHRTRDPRGVIGRQQRASAVCHADPSRREHANRGPSPGRTSDACPPTTRRRCQPNGENREKGSALKSASALCIPRVSNPRPTPPPVADGGSTALPELEQPGGSTSSIPPGDRAPSRLKPDAWFLTRGAAVRPWHEGHPCAMSDKLPKDFRTHSAHFVDGASTAYRRPSGQYGIPRSLAFCFSSSKSAPTSSSKCHMSTQPFPSLAMVSLLAPLAGRARSRRRRRGSATFGDGRESPADRSDGRAHRTPQAGVAMARLEAPTRTRMHTPT
jgi:hypothetical protein